MPSPPASSKTEPDTDSTSELPSLQPAPQQAGGGLKALELETGKVLWTGDLPTGSEGMPAMYEVNGRQFLVVPASSGINSGGGHGGPSSAPPATGQTKGYVAFALPDKASK